MTDLPNRPNILSFLPCMSDLACPLFASVLAIFLPTSGAFWSCHGECQCLAGRCPCCANVFYRIRIEAALGLKCKWVPIGEKCFFFLKKKNGACFMCKTFLVVYVTFLFRVVHLWHQVAMRAAGLLD